MDIDNFIQYLFSLRAECADMLLDKAFIQNDINNYNRIYTKRETITEILEELKKHKNYSEESNALKIRFTGTTII